MIKLDEKDLYQLLVIEVRYALKRDNHLAPSACAQHIKDYLPEMSHGWRSFLAAQLSEEIISERLLYSDLSDPEFKFEKDAVYFPSDTQRRQLCEDYIWEDLLVFLVNYLARLPYNTDKYMKHIRGHMTYSDGINYYSTEVQDKITENANKK